MRMRSLASALATVVLLAGCTGDDAGRGGDSGSMTPSPMPTTVAPSIARISAGGYHTCALDADGVAWCWGLDEYDQLGDGGTEDAAGPTRVVAPEIAAFSAIVTGNAHTCALDRDGAVWCWGLDGDGTDEADLNATHGPERIAFPDGARITALDGYFHSCALDEDGGAWCWGRNTEGQLGVGTRVDAAAPTPVEVPDGVTFTAIATGGYHTCALDVDGGAWCWGRDLRGQLGDGRTATDHPTSHPVAMPDGVTFVALAAGFDHTCALATDGAAWCWGDDTSGQLGTGGADDVTTTPQPVAMPEGVTFSAIDAGNAHTCALDDAGTVWCWGLGVQGGGAEPAAVTTTPIAIALDGGATAISSGGFHTCALDAVGAVRCWGSGDSGQLGVGATPAAAAPALVVFPD